MKESFPLVTVVLPVYNSERFLADAIQSILDQTYFNLEILIINDGSSDESEDIIKSYVDPRINYLKLESNVGLIRALNIGFSQASGEYIARMDADDISIVDRIEKQVKFLNEHPDCSCVGGALKIIGSQEIIHFYSNYKTNRSFSLFESPCAHPAIMLRTEHVNGLKYNLDFDCAEDFKFLSDLLQFGEVSNIPDVVLEYRKHDMQISHTKFNLQKNSHTKIVAENIAKNFNLAVNQEVLHRYFRFEILTKKELIEVFSIYFKIFLKSLQDMRFDSRYIARRLKYLLADIVKGVW